MKTACWTDSVCQNDGMKSPKSKKNESKQRDSPDPAGEAHTGRKIGYVRVSDADQSEALQVDALEAAGCDVIYGDLGISGARIKRRSLDTLLYDLEPGDVLVVWKLDRLGRSMLHLLQLLEDLRENGVDFIALTQGIDTTTAIGRMLYGHLAVFAEFEREQIRERTKAGMEAARARGVHIGRPRAISPDVAVILRERLDAGAATIEMLAEELQISPQTIVRAVRDAVRM
ncbi:recombinase family protein [uncultured Tateyamaria sp.]|uniref:recombinase family protein n=1 Tax=uncultured Tateyamaria sp. TaxID=455651 RepID=UPI00262A1D84|nr:recombinase family protein [uncultured Tateyamaria sp.]